MNPAHAIATAHERFRDLGQWVPTERRLLANPQTAIPAIAKDTRLMRLIDDAVRSIPTAHRLYLRDARSLDDLDANSVHLVVTSLPYRTLEETVLIRLSQTPTRCSEP